MASSDGCLQNPRLPLPPRTFQGCQRRSKVGLFRRLFRGRDDVYPVRWESKASGKSGYTPAYANEWRDGVCDKRRVKCAFGNLIALPLQKEPRNKGRSLFVDGDWRAKRIRDRPKPSEKGVAGYEVLSGESCGYAWNRSRKYSPGRSLPQPIDLNGDPPRVATPIPNTLGQTTFSRNRKHRKT